MRHLSLLNHTVIFYNTNGILRELKIHMRDFREIMVLSGTDYNSGGGASGDLRKTMKQYQRFRTAEPDTETPFRDWLCENTDYKLDNTSFTHIYDMFRVTDDSKVALKSSYMDVGKMKDILKPYGFVFV
jgi:hypothetical protein